MAYFKSGNECGSLRPRIYKDFSSDTARMEMSICGLIDKLLSGPWMKKFYTSSETEINHVEGIEVVRDVLKKLQEAKQWPKGLLETAPDFFCNLLQNDSTLSAVQKVLQNDVAKYIQQSLKFWKGHTPATLAWTLLTS